MTFMKGARGKGAESIAIMEGGGSRRTSSSSSSSLAVPMARQIATPSAVQVTEVGVVIMRPPLPPPQKRHSNFKTWCTGWPSVKGQSDFDIILEVPFSSLCSRFPTKIACRTSPFLWSQSFRISLRNFWCRRSAAAVGAQEEISGRTQVSSSEFGAGFDNRSWKVCQTERSKDIPCPASSCPNRNIACKTVYFLPLLSLHRWGN